MAHLWTPKGGLWCSRGRIFVRKVSVSLTKSMLGVCRVGRGVWYTRGFYKPKHVLVGTRKIKGSLLACRVQRAADLLSAMGQALGSAAALSSGGSAPSEFNTLTQFFLLNSFFASFLARM